MEELQRLALRIVLDNQVHDHGSGTAIELKNYLVREGLLEWRDGIVRTTEAGQKLLDGYPGVTLSGREVIL